MKRNYPIYGYILLLFALISIILWQYYYYSALNVNSIVYIKQLNRLTGVGFLTTRHVHADFKIYINGGLIDLNKIELQAPEFGSLGFWNDANTSKFVHLHGGEPNKDVLHVHATGIKLAMFFRTIGGRIGPGCISFPQTISKASFCNKKDKTLKVFINGIITVAPFDYEMQDLDKLLITYGNDSDAEISRQIKSIGNNACFQSRKC